MLMLPSAVRIYLYRGGVDMRRGFDGLTGLVTSAGMNVFSGHLFVFVSRRGDRVKILAWERGGLALWSKRLEQGSFRVPVHKGSGPMQLDAGQLALLLEGIDASRVRRSKRWEPPCEHAA